MVARIAGNDEWLTVTEDRAKDILSTAVAALTIAMARIALAMVAVERGDAASAEEQYAALVSVSGMMVYYISTDRVLGLLAQTMGDLGQAVDHFEDALAFCRKAGYRPELAWSFCDYADMLRERDAEGDRAKVITLLDESLAISSELGMRPLMERVLYRREILGA